MKLKELPLAWPPGARYALALGLFFLGLLARFAMAPQQGGLAFVTFYPVILMSFFLVGTGPGAFTAALSGLAGQYFFIPPYRTFLLDLSSHKSLAVFAVTASLMGWTISRLHRTARSLRATLDQRREAERELAEYRDRLEELVALRTRELAEARSAAEAANTAKSVFLANMSHEIRTPMNGVLGVASILRRTGVTVQQGGYLDKIEACGRYLLSIVDDVLDLTKIEAGKLQFERQDFTLDDLIESVDAVMGDRAAAKGLSFRVDTAGAPQCLRGDSARLTQALVNFVANAVKFTEQGSIVLGCRLLEEGSAGYLLRFEVSDTGIGVTADEQIRIFQPFEQADNSARRRYKGTGLGLAITRRIAELMGGEVGVESEQGKGSCFWLTVRLEKGTPPAPKLELHEGAESVLSRDFKGTRVLLAEDDPVGREIAQYLLQTAGLVVEIAENGADAVRMAAATDFALIVTDMQMPVMDGLQATAAIRALPGRRATPILALTANAFDEDRRKCFEAGMNDFIVKPFEPKLLFETVLKWLWWRSEFALSSSDPA